MNTAYEMIHGALINTDTLIYQLWHNPEKLSIGSLLNLYANDFSTDYLAELFTVYGRQRVGLALMELNHYLLYW